MYAHYSLTLLNVICIYKIRLNEINVTSLCLGFNSATAYKQSKPFQPYDPSTVQSQQLYEQSVHTAVLPDVNTYGQQTVNGLGNQGKLA